MQFSRSKVERFKDTSSTAAITTLGPGCYETDHARQVLESHAYRNISLPASARFNDGGKGLENLGPGAYNVKANTGGVGGGAVCKGSNGASSGRVSLSGRGRRNGRRSMSVGARTPLQTLPQGTRLEGDGEDKFAGAPALHAVESESERLRRRLRQALSERDALKLENKNLSAGLEGAASTKAREVFFVRDKGLRHSVAAAAARKQCCEMQQRLIEAEDDVVAQREAAELSRQGELCLSFKSKCQEILLENARWVLGEDDDDDDHAGDADSVEGFSEDYYDDIDVRKGDPLSEFLLDQIATLNELVASLQNQVSEITFSEQEAWDRVLAANEASLEDTDRIFMACTEIDDSLAANARLECQIADFAERIEELEAEATQALNARSEADEALVRYSKENALLQDRLDAALRDVSETKSAGAALEQSLEDLHQQLSCERAALAAAQLEATEHKETGAALQEALAANNANLNSAEQALEAVREELGQKQAVLAVAAEAEVQAARAEADAARSLIALNATLSSKIVENQQQAGELETIKEELSATRQKLAEAVTTEALLAREAVTAEACAVASLSKLEHELQTTRAVLDAAQSKLVAATSASTALEEELSAARNSNVEITERASSLETLLTETRNAKELVCSELKAIRVQLAGSLDEITCTKDELSQARVELGEANMTLKEVQAKLNCTESELKDAHISSEMQLENVREQLQAGNEELHAEIEKMASQHLVELENTRTETAAELKHLRAQQVELQTKHDSVVAKCAELETASEAASKAVLQTRSDRSELEVRVISLQEERRQLQNELAVARARPSAQALANKVAALEAEVVHIRNSDQAHRAEVHMFRSRLAQNDRLREDELSVREKELAVAKAVGMTATQELQLLAEENASLAGHNNTRQKIQHLKKIKQENAELKLTVSKLKSKCKRQDAQIENLHERRTEVASHVHLPQ